MNKLLYLIPLDLFVSCSDDSDDSKSDDTENAYSEAQKVLEQALQA